MKEKMLQWMMTNLCAWACIEQNALFRRAYLDLFDDLSRQAQHWPPDAGPKSRRFSLRSETLWKKRLFYLIIESSPPGGRAGISGG